MLMDNQVYYKKYGKNWKLYYKVPFDKDSFHYLGFANTENNSNIAYELLNGLVKASRFASVAFDNKTINFTFQDACPIVKVRNTIQLPNLKSITNSGLQIRILVAMTTELLFVNPEGSKTFALYNENHCLVFKGSYKQVYERLTFLQDLLVFDVVKDTCVKECENCERADDCQFTVLYEDEDEEYEDEDEGCDGDCENCFVHKASPESDVVRPEVKEAVNRLLDFLEDGGETSLAKLLSTNSTTSKNKEIDAHIIDAQRGIGLGIKLSLN